MEKLKIRDRPLGNVDHGHVVAPAGPIRATNCEMFRDHVDALLLEKDEITALVVDFSKVEFIDSSTAGFLLSVHDRLSERGGALALAALTPGVRVVIDSIGLTTFFMVCETIEEAAEELAG